MRQDAKFGNDYERSKAAAEQLVQSASFLDSTTIFRPSIIVGDSQSGTATAFHGIYTALQLGYLYLLAKLHEGWQLDVSLVRQVVEENFVKRLGVTGCEHKNLVPLDWVSAAILQIVERAEHHGKIYHLTHPRPVTIDGFKEAMIAAVMERVDEMKRRRASIPLSLLESDGFRDYMGVYRSYFKGDPDFDTTNTTAAVPDLSCPELDHDTMVRLWRYAIDTDFAHRLRQPLSSGEFASLLATLPEPTEPGRDLILQISGPGGGSWLVQFDNFAPARSVPRSYNGQGPLVYTGLDALLTLAGGTFTIEDSLANGCLILRAGDTSSIADVTRMYQALLDWIHSQRFPPTRTAPPAVMN